MEPVYQTNSISLYRWNQLEWQTTSSSSEGSGEDSSSDDNPCTPIPPRKKKTSDELDADYIPNDEEVNRNMSTIL